jgi:hypothetical protein
MPERAYRVTLIPLAGGAPGLVRLRRALKVLLRHYRLRAAAIEEIGSCDEAHNIAPARAREGDG